MENKSKPTVEAFSLCLSDSIGGLLDKGQTEIAIKLMSVAFTSLKETTKAEGNEDFTQFVTVGSTTRMFSSTSVSKSSLWTTTGKRFDIYRYELRAKGYCRPVLKISLSTENMDEKEASNAVAGLYACVCGILKGEIDPKLYAESLEDRS